jgi:pentose-5-phosphate-3-epimerase
MWSILSKEDNETVIGVLAPNTPLEEVENVIKKGFTLILMTIENSPGYINGKYIDGKFYPKEEMVR